MDPHCLHQVSVNPAYQAMELEYALKKVGPFLGCCGRSQLVPSTGGVQLSQKAERGGGHAQGDTLSLSFSRQWVGGGDGWSDRLVCVLGLVAVCILVAVYGGESNCQDSTTILGWGFLLTVVGGSASTGGLQSHRISQAIQVPALLQHPEADLSRGGKGPARGLEESEVGVVPGWEGNIIAVSWPPLSLPISVGPPSVPDSHHAPHHQAPGSDHGHLGRCPSARDAAPG